MSFHCLDHVEYICSGRKLSNMMLQTLAKYFESIFLAHISNGLIRRKYNEQLCSAAKRKLHHNLKEHYREKLKRLSESREHHYSCTWHCKRDSRSTCGGRSTRNAIIATLKLIAPATRTLAEIKRALPRTVSSTSCAICMASTASIPTTSAVRIQRTKHVQTPTTTTTLKTCPQHALP